MVQNIRLFGIGYGTFHYNLKFWEVLEGLYLLVVYGLCKFRGVLGRFGVATLRVRPRIGNKLGRFVMFKEIWGRYAPGTTADW